jgi:heme exporter protein D
METTSHFGFIMASYGAAVVVVGGLLAWVTLDYFAQIHRLADLEARGVTRRSANAQSELPAPKAREAREKV